MNTPDWNELFLYDETSPSCLRWRHDGYAGKGYTVKIRSAGGIVGCLEKEGYWQVNVKCKSYRINRIVWDMHNPDDLAGRDAVDHFDQSKDNNRIGNLRKVPHVVNSRNRRKSAANSSGVTGVGRRIDKCNGLASWHATWSELDGTPKHKSFPCSKFGEDDAFKLACEFRASQIERLNSQLAGYTEQHGKE